MRALPAVHRAGWIEVDLAPFQQAYATCAAKWVFAYVSCVAQRVAGALAQVQRLLRFLAERLQAPVLPGHLPVSPPSSSLHRQLSTPHHPALPAFPPLSLSPPSQMAPGPTCISRMASGCSPPPARPLWFGISSAPQALLNLMGAIREARRQAPAVERFEEPLRRRAAFVAAHGAALPRAVQARLAALHDQRERVFSALLPAAADRALALQGQEAERLQRRVAAFAERLAAFRVRWHPATPAAALDDGVSAAGDFPAACGVGAGTGCDGSGSGGGAGGADRNDGAGQAMLPPGFLPQGGAGLPFDYTEDAERAIALIAEHQSRLRALDAEARHLTEMQARAWAK